VTLTNLLRDKGHKVRALLEQLIAERPTDVRGLNMQAGLA